MNKGVFTLFILLYVSIIGHVWSQEITTEASAVSSDFIHVGNEFNDGNILNSYQMQEEYENLKPGDTLTFTFSAIVSSVCKNKGCWMKVALEDGREVMVRFKDYAFFVPKDIENQTVIVNGLAYVEEMSVEEQKHYAKDEGKSTEKIKMIVQPQKTLSFIADGVKIKK